jgi:hypothetical protein
VSTPSKEYAGISVFDGRSVSGAFVSSRSVSIKALAAADQAATMLTIPREKRLTGDGRRVFECNWLP